MSDAALTEAIAASRDTHDAWREDRAAAVTGPTGNLSLVETRWLPAGEVPDTAAEQAAAGEGITVTALARTNIDTGETEHGVRVWDAASPAIRAFDRITAFDFAPEWVITAQFTPVAADRTVPFEHIRDNGGSRDLVVPGDITFTRNGVEYRFAAFDDGGTLLLVFGDPTNTAQGEDATYGAGRFLFVQRADGASFGDPGTVLLDFNRAFVPPCGFSVQYNCPMPPAQNRFPEPVLAGEKQVVFTGDFDIYAL
ncbi:DUF1684 domain-containing protein [Leucobacter chromiireducens]|uniref:DUF1684 domain-containing protein n=1 Tax=Leucobacter chromiireducens subsp. solipictus TaxID=398235 RepID=A0ABS1SCF0_9MICO|nr:DUF1684 domain-containing protein [Leucobacter chromiireducens]MBL3678222.1 DUF1684 domain-containing protein [Leucobacter chromiireducens subsp. solipictus]